MHLPLEAAHEKAQNGAAYLVSLIVVSSIFGWCGRKL